MTQVTDYIVPGPPASGAVVFTRINSTFASILDDNAGVSGPTNPVPGMRWRDISVSPSVLRVRNDTNTAWVDQLTSLGVTATAARINALAALSASVPFLVANAGDTLIAVSAATARQMLGAAPVATTVAGPGQFVLISSAASAALVLPAGGTWKYHASRFTNGVVNNFVVGIAAGGTTIGAAVAGQNWGGWAERISA